MEANMNRDPNPRVNAAGSSFLWGVRILTILSMPPSFALAVGAEVASGKAGNLTMGAVSLFPQIAVLILLGTKARPLQSLSLAVSVPFGWWMTTAAIALSPQRWAAEKPFVVSMCHWSWGLLAMGAVAAFFAMPHTKRDIAILPFLAFALGCAVYLFEVISGVVISEAFG